MSEYIGNRIVPRHDGVWDKAKEYEPLTIVYEEATGDSYISRKPVPAGTLLSQEDYWALCSRFSEQMALYRQNTAEDVATLRKMTAQDVADITQKVDAANSAVAANKSEMDKTAETLKAQIDANVKASTDKNANYAQELVDARVDDTGKTYGTAGENVRAIGRVRSMQNIMKNWYLNAGYTNQNGNLVASDAWRVAHMSRLYWKPLSGKRNLRKLWQMFVKVRMSPQLLFYRRLTRIKASLLNKSRKAHQIKQYPRNNQPQNPKTSWMPESRPLSRKLWMPKRSWNSRTSQSGYKSAWRASSHSFLLMKNRRRASSFQLRPFELPKRKSEASTWLLTSACLRT